jgi:hypothetical protein
MTFIHPSMLVRAFRSASRRLSSAEGADCTSTSTSAGMVHLPDGRVAQVFVKCAIFDPQLLQDKPDTGGLLCMDVA